MIIIRTAVSADLPMLTAIYNAEILHGTATFDIAPKTLEDRRYWLEQHNRENHPLLVAEWNQSVAGYASLSPYSEKEAYRSTVELSIYVAAVARRNGVATALMRQILQLAREDPVTHTVISVITDGNQASVLLHQNFGFQYCGTLQEVGLKFGTYQSVSYYSLYV